MERQKGAKSSLGVRVCDISKWRYAVWIALIDYEAKVLRLLGRLLVRRPPAGAGAGSSMEGSVITMFVGSLNLLFNQEI